MKHYFETVTQLSLLLVFFGLGQTSTLPRKFVCLYESTASQTPSFNRVHRRYELFLNHHGYLCEYHDFDLLKAPQPEADTAGIVFSINTWNGDKLQRIEKILNSFHERNLKILWFGTPPYRVGTRFDPVISRIEKMLQIKVGYNSIDSKLSQKIESKAMPFRFESMLSPLTLGKFVEVEPVNAKEIFLTLRSNQLKSQTIFLADWGGMFQEDILFSHDGQHHRWQINPHELFRKIFPKPRPIPDTTTIAGKRIVYIHIDGDGALNLVESERDVMSSELGFRLIKEYPLKIGVSFIANEIDPKFQGNPEVQEIARKIFALKHVEPSSHTYSHPYSWARGIVAFSTRPEDAKPAMYGGIPALREKGGKINLQFEVLDSLAFINRFTPENKKAITIYYSGDCAPTEEQLRFLRENNIRAFNGGDSFYDDLHPSLTYVYPLYRQVGKERQFYCTGSNENVYTHLWSLHHWGFRRVLETFRRTEKPIRIKPINLYYHFYVLEKIASQKVMEEIYSWIWERRNNLASIYPSEYMKIMENYLQIEVDQLSTNEFLIRNMSSLHDFRLEGHYEVQSDDLSYLSWDEDQNVTYFQISPEKGSAKVIIEAVENSQ